MSVRDQSGCRAAFGAPPASPVSAGGGPGLPLRGTCGCAEGSGSPTGPPRVVAVGSLSQGQGSARMQLGMSGELSPGGQRHRAGPGTERPRVRPPGPSSPAPGHDPAGLSFSGITWPFPELRGLNSCSPAPPANSSCPKCLALYRTAPSPLTEPALQLCSNVSLPVLTPGNANRSTLVGSKTQL